MVDNQNNINSLDPLGHIKIAVSSLEESKSFYSKLAVFFADPDGIKLEVAFY